MGGNLSSELFNESFVSLIFEYGQSISLCARVLSIVIDGVEQAVTGGSLRQNAKKFFEKCKSSCVQERKTESESHDENNLVPLLKLYTHWSRFSSDSKGFG